MLDPRSAYFSTVFVPFLRRLAAELCQRRRTQAFEVFTKTDDSPVTSADFWASEAWCQFLVSHFPADAIVSEEHPEFRRGTSGRTWFIDPIDGTKQFIDRSSDFYVLAGLEEKGKPIFGLHLNPERNWLIVGTPGIGVFGFDLSLDEPHPVPLEREGAKSTHFYLKGVSPDQRHAFLTKFNFTKPAFPSPHVHMLSPFAAGASGFATFRETWYWDLLAPAAIAIAAGMNVEMRSLNGQSDFSDEAIKCRSLFCLPPDVNEAVLNDLRQLKQSA